MNETPMRHILHLLPAAAIASALVVASSARAEAPAQPAPMLEGAAAGTVLTDDDGGLVQVVPSSHDAAKKPAFHGGRVLARARVNVLFLGSAWRDHRDLEARAVAGVEAAARAGGEKADAGGVAIAEDLSDPASARVNDLEVQRRLERTWGSAPVSGDALTVVFVAPGLPSSIGDALAGRDFLAYHNFFHAESGTLVYAVVPFAADAARWDASTRRCVGEALANPEGDGWY